jgi:hypothetical protein
MDLDLAVVFRNDHKIDSMRTDRPAVDHNIKRSLDLKRADLPGLEKDLENIAVFGLDLRVVIMSGGAIGPPVPELPQGFPGIS